MNNSTLCIEQVNKWYPGDVHAVKDMDMEIAQGEFMVFVGPSGCGKTTLLRMIAGLEQISGGVIRMGDQVLNRVQPKNRDIAMVFQNYALYPTMRVWDNIAFPLKMRKTRKKEIAPQVEQVAGRLGLTELLARRPGALSGGQRQRVALGRAMVRQPKLFLMDEPLSNLDAKLRAGMRREIVSLQRDLGVTTIYVTHDQTEAMTMGTRIAVMKDGVLQQLGPPREVYNTPRNLFVAQFIGSPPMNIWEGTAEEGRVFLGGHAIGAHCAALGECRIGIRPEHLSPGEGPDAIPMEVQAVENTGREAFVYLRTPDGIPLAMATDADFDGAEGDWIPVRLNPRKLHFFDRETEERL